VGTPDYIAPEVFKQEGYTETIDWWSVGAILFEMMIGHPPFFSDDPSITCQKILRWEKTLKIPSPQEVKLSPEAIDILKRLLCGHNERLGKTGVQEIKNHPFFKGIDWKNLRRQKAAFSPKIKDDEDCSRFDDFEEEEPFYPGQKQESPSKGGNKRKDINFLGYTYKKEVEEQKTKLVQALKGLLDNGSDGEEPPE
jgi:serine/threonine kinase 38